MIVLIAQPHVVDHPAALRLPLRPDARAAGCCRCPSCCRASGSRSPASRRATASSSRSCVVTGIGVARVASRGLQDRDRRGGRSQGHGARVVLAGRQYRDRDRAADHDASLITTAGLAGTLGMLAPSVVMAGAVRRRAAPHRARRCRRRARPWRTTRGVNMPGAMALLILVVDAPLVDDARVHDVRAVLLPRRAEAGPADGRRAALRLPRRGRARRAVVAGPDRRSLGRAAVRALGASSPRCRSASCSCSPAASPAS